VATEDPAGFDHGKDYKNIDGEIEREA